MKHSAHIRTRQRLPLRLGGINPRVDPRAFAGDLGEKSKLPAGPRPFARQAGERQAGLLVGARQQGVAEGFDLSLFAQPPDVGYPTSVSAAPDALVVRQKPPVFS